MKTKLENRIELANNIVCDQIRYILWNKKPPVTSLIEESRLKILSKVDGQARIKVYNQIHIQISNKINNSLM